jgi:CrcB protein
LKAALLVATGGMAGALARFYLATAMAARFGTAFPYGTLLINVTGCFILGLLGTLGAERATIITPEGRLLLGVGFCGAYTTFSTFGLETLTLLRAGAIGQAGLYMFASNLIGLLAVFLGFQLARWVP